MVAPHVQARASRAATGWKWAHTTEWRAVWVTGPPLGFGRYDVGWCAVVEDSVRMPARKPAISLTVG